MLNRRDHALALDPVDRLGGEHGTQYRILRKILEITPVAWVSSEIDAARQLDIESPASRLKAIMRPPARARSELKLDPSAMLAGSAVAVSPSRNPGLMTPRLALLIRSAGTPRRGTPGV